MKARRTIAALAAILISVSMAAQANILTIDAGQKGIPIQETMFGLFYEDINFAADGGLYAELIKNRCFLSASSEEFSELLCRIVKTH